MPAFRKSIPVLVLAALFALTGPWTAASAAEGGEPGAEEDSQPWLFGDQPQFFRLRPFNIPVMRGGRVVSQVTLTLMIETLGRSDKQKVMDKRGHLYSAFMRDLHGAVSVQYAQRRSVYVPALKIRLRRVADRVLGPGIVKNVLVQNVYTRRFD